MLQRSVKLKKGYLAAILSAIFFGSAGLIVKFAFGEGLDSIELLTLQYIIAVIIMFLIIFVSNKKALKVSGKTIFDLAVLGVIGNTFMTVFYYTAFKYLPVAMVAILLYTYPIIVFIYSFLFKKEKVNMTKFIALALAFIGCILALGLIPGNLKYSSMGILCGLLSAVFYAFMSIFTETKLHNVDSLTINLYSTMFSLLSLMIFKFPTFIIKGQFTFKVLGYTTILAVICEIIPLTLLYLAIKHIGALKVSIIGNLEIPTAMILSYLFLNESVSILQVAGAALVIYAVYSIRT